jgi:hypothetical protein
MRNKNTKNKTLPYKTTIYLITLIRGGINYAN